jgi:hypothetical protein
MQKGALSGSENTIRTPELVRCWKILNGSKRGDLVVSNAACHFADAVIIE